MQIDNDSSGCFTKYWLSYQIKDFNIRTKDKNYVGFYKEPKVDANLIMTFPFEMWYSAEWTLARLITITLWNELTSCPRFLKQN